MPAASRRQARRLHYPLLPAVRLRFAPRSSPLAHPATARLNVVRDVLHDHRNASAVSPPLLRRPARRRRRRSGPRGRAGHRPRRESCSCANAFPPPEPNLVEAAAVRTPEARHVLGDPEHVRVVFTEHPRPFTASSSATSCGVVTIGARQLGSVWRIVSWVSPVPGGRSITR